jgi:hypothetical protein
MMVDYGFNSVVSKTLLRELPAEPIFTSLPPQVGFLPISFHDYVTL